MSVPLRPSILVMWVEIFLKCDNPCSETNAAKLCGPDAAIRFALYQQSFVTYFENTCGGP